jgi:hypothetical protein
MHGGPEIAALLTVKNLLRVRQPIKISASKTERERTVKSAPIDRDRSFDAKFVFLFDTDVFDVDLRIAPGKAKRTIIQL